MILLTINIPYLLKTWYLILAVYGLFMTPDKDPLTYSLITYYWVIGLSTLGAIVSFHQKVKRGITRAWNLTEFVGEVVTSGFVGILTFFLCEYSEMPKMLEAFFVGVSGHMGTRMIFLFENYLEKRSKAFMNSAAGFMDSSPVKKDEE